jgi:hypothetical protein
MPRRFEDSPWIKSDSELFDIVAGAIADYEEGITNPLTNIIEYKEEYGKPSTPIKNLADEWIAAVNDIASLNYNSSVLAELHQDDLPTLDAITDLTDAQKQKMRDWYAVHNLVYTGVRYGGRRRTYKSKKSRKTRKSRKSKNSRRVRK